MTPPEGTEATVGLGAAASGLSGTDIVIPVGPRNPAMHGALRIVVTLDGETIVRATPVIGYVHRGAEKLFEVRDYRQILVLANRHDWLSAYANEVALALAVERLMGLEVPPRAVWLRTLLCELNRLTHHLAHLGGDALETGDEAALESASAAREALQDVLEQYSGGRMHFMVTRIGGLLHDVPDDGWLDRVLSSGADVRARLDDLARLASPEEAVARLRGVGVLSVEDVAAYGVSGPAARASGVGIDLRRDEPYLGYGELEVPLIVGAVGDCVERFACLLAEVPASLDWVAACIDRIRDLPPGPVATRLPKTVRPPEGDVYAWTENPSGINGYYLVSRGERTPWRLKLRTAGFNNMAAVPRLLAGCRITDLVPILSSLFFVMGDVDK